jgi:hypothetical protein
VVRRRRGRPGPARPAACHLSSFTPSCHPDGRNGVAGRCPPRNRMQRPGVDAKAPPRAGGAIGLARRMRDSSCVQGARRSWRDGGDRADVRVGAPRLAARQSRGAGGPAVGPGLDAGRRRTARSGLSCPSPPAAPTTW